MYVSPVSRLRRGLVGLLVLVLAGLTPVLSSGGVRPASAAEPAPRGYWMVASDGGIFAYGGARFFGSTGNVKLNMPIVGMAPTPSGNGYWLVASDGGIFAFGDAGFFGSTGNIKLNKPIVGMAATQSGKGYWLVASDGGIFAFGDALFYGSTGNMKLNKPITGMAPSASGKGYRMVATDGGIFSFGDAAFFGSAGGSVLANPISGMAPTPSGKGYWLVGTDGAILPYGDAASHGSASALRSVAAMAPTPSGAGYWTVGADGSLAAFGDAVDLGHPTGALTKPIVGLAVLPSSASATSGGGGGTTNSTTPGATIPGGDPGTTTTTLPPVVSNLNKLYASHALDGTIGTRPQVMLDPSHPFREVCDQKPCTESNANYAEEIRTFALHGNRLFVGGFIHGLLDPSTGGKGTKIYDEIEYLVELDSTTGKVASDLTFTRNAAPDSTVEGMEVSPDGKYLYISGRFTRAGGGRAPMFAILELDGPRAGLLAEGFDPSTPKGGSIHGLTAHGDRLFLAGAFNEIDGKSQYNKVAAVDARTGKLIEGWVPPPITGSFVDRQGTPMPGEAGAANSVAVLAGKYVVVGGEFVHAGKDAPTSGYDAHSGLTVLNVSDGQLADWRPRNDRPVFQMALSPDRSFVCAAVGGQGGGVTCLRPGEEWPMFNTAKKPDWPGMSEHARLDRRIAHVDGDALGVAITDKRVYLGGHFDVEEPDPDHDCLHAVPSKCMPPFSKSAGPHRHLVAYDFNGNPDHTWTPQADTAEGPTTLLAGPNGLYLGGNLRHTMDKHPSAHCWPCTQGSNEPRHFHPGFAIFPAVP